MGLVQKFNKSLLVPIYSAALFGSVASATLLACSNPVHDIGPLNCETDDNCLANEFCDPETKTCQPRANPTDK